MKSNETNTVLHTPAPIGATLFASKVWSQDGRERFTDFSGFYQTREASLRGIANWILEDYRDNPEKEPECNHTGGMDEGWILTDPQEFLEYLASHTDEEIIDEFFLVEDDRDWSIEEVKISPFEDRNI